MEKILIQQHSTTGILWIVGWLFTVGYLHLSFWPGALALLIWPYHIGASVAGFHI